MFAKAILILATALVAVSKSSVIPAHLGLAHGHVGLAPAPAPVAVAPVPIYEKLGEYNHHPQYSYAYGVSDALTGDSKTQQETRDGDVVQGSYSLIEPDGTRRIVEYTADPVNGFNAVVHREPAVIKPVVQAVVPIAEEHHHPLAFH